MPDADLVARQECDHVKLQFRAGASLYCLTCGGRWDAVRPDGEATEVRYGVGFRMDMEFQRG